MEEFKNKIKDIQLELETKNELNLIAQGRLSALELELNGKDAIIVDKDSKIQRYLAIMKKMNMELKTVKEKTNEDKVGKVSKENETLKEKLKKKTEECKEKAKNADKLKEVEQKWIKNIAELELKLSTENNLRAKAEADNIRAGKFNDHLQEICNLKGVLGNKKTLRNL